MFYPKCPKKYQQEESLGSYEENEPTHKFPGSTQAELYPFQNGV